MKIRCLKIFAKPTDFSQCVWLKVGLDSFSEAEDHSTFIRIKLAYHTGLSSKWRLL